MIVIVLPSVVEDKQLLRKAKKFDKEAMRVIYERYFPSIYSFIRLRINNREQARDVAADVFLDFMVTLQGRKPPHSNLRGWLFRVARNKIYQQYGKQKKLSEMALGEWIPTDNADEPEAQVLQTLETDKLREAIISLNSEQQEVIILRFGQGLNLQETSDMMNKTVSAIKSLQFRAIQNLRELIEAGEKE